MTSKKREVRKLVAYLMRDGLGYEYTEIKDALKTSETTARNDVKDVERELEMRDCKRELAEAKKCIEYLESYPRLMGGKTREYLDERSYRELDDEE